MMEKKIVKRIILLVLVCATVICMSVSCAKTEASKEAAVAGESVEGTSKLIGSPDDEYYMVTFMSGIEFWSQCRVGFEDAGKLYGIAPIYAGSELYDVEACITVLEQVIAKQPKGIAVTCMNADAYVNVLNRAIDNGIAVVTFNADSPDSKRYSYVGPDNYSGGVTAGKKMAEILDHTGKVAVISVTGQSNHEDRARGFVEYINENEPDMEVVQVGNGETDETISATVASGIMQANPDLAGFFSTNSAGTVGLASAVKEAGKKGDIKIIGFDQNEAILDALKDGTVTASISQNNWQMGYWAMHELYLLVNGCLQENWEEKNLAPLPNHMNTDFAIITADNANAYYVDK